MDALTLRVNGARATVEAPPDATLLDVLRGDLGLNGSRFGCGQGLCGACLVLVDDRPTFSCETPLWSVAGRAVSTVEAVVATETGRTLREALLAGQAGQCGYCLNGVLVRLAAALEAGRRTRADLAQALERHLCRCGAQRRVLDAAEAAAALLDARST